MCSVRRRRQELIKKKNPIRISIFNPVTFFFSSEIYLFIFIPVSLFLIFFFCLFSLFIIFFSFAYSYSGLGWSYRMLIKGLFTGGMICSDHASVMPCYQSISQSRIRNRDFFRSSFCRILLF